MVEERTYYVSINSLLYDVLNGTNKGSDEGPVLYAIYICPLIDVEDMSSFADDNHIIRLHHNHQELIIIMKNLLAKRAILKAPPVNPGVYIYRYYNGGV